LFNYSDTKLQHSIHMIVRLRKNFTNGLKNELGAGHFSRVHNLERWEAKLVGISKKEIEGAFYATLMRCMSHIVPLVFLQIFKARSSQWPSGTCPNLWNRMQKIHLLVFFCWTIFLFNYLCRKYGV